MQVFQTYTDFKQCLDFFFYIHKNRTTTQQSQMPISSEYLMYVMTQALKENFHKHAMSVPVIT